MSKARRMKVREHKSHWKILLVLVLMIFTMLGMNYKTEIQTSILNLKNGGVTSYAINDYVKAIYTEGNNTRYLPIRYDKHEETITRGAIEEKFREAGIEIESMTSPTGILGTGTQVKVKSGAVYTIVIYGDVNGDGVVNIQDAQRIIQCVIRPGNSTYALNGAYRKAANLEDTHIDTLNVQDAQRIVQFILSKKGIIDSLPESDISRDKTKPTIENGTETVNIVVGGTYVEEATVTDNLDPNVKLQIKYFKDGVEVSRIDTSVEGEYTVVYYAKDAAGNEAEASRIVKIEPIRHIQFNVKENVKYAFNLTPISMTPENPDYAKSGKAKFEAAKANGDYEVTAMDEGTSLEVTVEGLDDIDFTVPGTHKITYTATNLQGIEEKIEKIITIVNPVTKIELAGSLDKTTYNDGDELDLSGINAKVTYLYTIGVETNKSITDLEKDENFVIDIDKFASRTLKYNASNDSKNAGIDVNVKAIYTNPADNEDIVYSDKAEGYITGRYHNAGKIRIIGEIDEIISSVGSVQTSGEPYYKMNIANITTKANQKDLTKNNLTYSVTKNGEEVSDAHVFINIPNEDTDAKNIVNVEFWAENAGTYEVTLKSGNATYKTNEINITDSTIVDEVRLVKNTDGDLYEGLLKAGTSKYIELKFYHTYDARNIEGINDYVQKEVPVTANRLKLNYFDAESSNPDTNYNGIRDELIKYYRITENGYQQITKTDSRIAVNAISVEVDANATVTGNYDLVNLKFSVTNAGTEVYTKNPLVEEIKVFPKSVFTVDIKETSTDVYLESAVATSNAKYVEYNGLVYTLIEAKMYDDYKDWGDQAEALINVDDLSTKYSDIANGKITLIDSGYEAALAANNSNAKSLISVKGFNDNHDKNGYIICTGGTAKYIGIAVDRVNKNGDIFLDNEDDELNKTGHYVSVYHNGRPITEININIVKKRITSIEAELVLQTNSMYCYDSNTVVAKFSSGAKQADLNLGELDYSIYNVGYTNTSTGQQEYLSLNTTAWIKEKSVDEFGNVYVSLTAPNSGKYKIGASIGTNTDKSKIIATPINVEEDTSVSSIAFKYKDIDTKKTVITADFGTVRENKAATHEMVYTHIYEFINKEGNKAKVEKEIAETNKPLANSIELVVDASHPCIKVDSMNGNKMAAPQQEVLGIRVDYTSTKNHEHDPGHPAYFEIRIKDESNNVYYRQEVEVTTKEEAKIVDLVMSEVEKTSSKEEITDNIDYKSKITSNSEITLYKGKAADAEEDPGAIDPRTSEYYVTEDIYNPEYEMYYSIYKIAYIDEDGDERPVPMGNIRWQYDMYRTLPNAVWIVDSYYIDDSSTGRVETLAISREILDEKDPVTGKYYRWNEATGSSSTPVSYIGISPSAGFDTVGNIIVSLNKTENGNSWERTQICKLSRVTVKAVSSESSGYTMTALKASKALTKENVGISSFSTDTSNEEVLKELEKNTNVVDNTNNIDNTSEPKGDTQTSPDAVIPENNTNNELNNNVITDKDETTGGDGNDGDGNLSKNEIDKTDVAVPENSPENEEE